MQFWFNVDTRQVESHDDPKRARAANLLGPYETQGEAEQALAKAAERTEEWDEQDRKFDARDDDEDDDGPVCT